MRSKNNLFLLALLVPSLALAEGVGPQDDLPSNPSRVRGVQTLLSAPWGLLTLGGPSLRLLRPGKTRWETLLRVPGGNLYRVAADEKGRVLAAWEGEKVFHLLDPAAKKRIDLPKPRRSPADKRTANLEGLFFSKDGLSAVVYVNDLGAAHLITTSAYRYALSGKGNPAILFRQEGYPIYTHSKACLFVLPQGDQARWDRGTYGPVAQVLAYDFSGGEVVKRVLFIADKGESIRVRMAGGNIEEGATMVVSGGKSGPRLLAWRYGQAHAVWRSLPSGSSQDAEKSWMMKMGEWVEILRTADEGLKIKRYPATGGTQVVTLSALPPGDPDVELDTTVYSVRDLKGGGRLMHWGDYLVLLEDGKAPRALNVEPMLARMEEWAGADIYSPDPEALWIGVEVGAGRDFVRVGLDEVEKRAKLVK